MRVKHFSLTLSEEEEKKLTELASKLNKSKADILREALKLYAILKYAEGNGKEIILRDTRTGELEKLVLP